MRTLYTVSLLCTLVLGGCATENFSVMTISRSATYQRDCVGPTAKWTYRDSECQYYNQPVPQPGSVRRVTDISTAGQPPGMAPGSNDLFLRIERCRRLKEGCWNCNETARTVLAFWAGGFYFVSTQKPSGSLHVHPEQVSSNPTSSLPVFLLCH